MRSLALCLLAFSTIARPSAADPIAFVPESLPTHEVASAWPLESELRDRVMALAFASTAGDAEPEVRQTSPRYAAHHVKTLASCSLAAAWVLDTSEREAAEAIAERLTREADGVLVKAFVQPGLATRVISEVVSRGDQAVLTVLVFASERGKSMDLVQLLQDEIDRFSAAAPNDDFRRVARRALGRHRRSVVELLPRNAADPGASAPRPPRAGADQAPPSAKTAAKVGKAAKGTKAPSARPKRVHPVKPGDTLIAIARRYKTSVTALVSANRLDAKRPIRVGQKIIVGP